MKLWIYVKPIRVLINILGEILWGYINILFLLKSFWGGKKRKMEEVILEWAENLIVFAGQYAVFIWGSGSPTQTEIHQLRCVIYSNNNQLFGCRLWDGRKLGSTRMVYFRPIWQKRRTRLLGKIFAKVGWKCWAKRPKQSLEVKTGEKKQLLSKVEELWQCEFLSKGAGRAEGGRRGFQGAECLEGEKEHGWKWKAAHRLSCQALRCSGCECLLPEWAD